MRILFSIENTQFWEVWLAEKERVIFGISQAGGARYLDANGVDCEYEPSFAPHPYHVDCKEEEHQRELEHIAAVCDGLIRFSDEEVRWDIDDGVGHFGFQDLDGNVVIESQYAWAGSFSHGLCPVNLGRTWYRSPSGDRWYENHYGYINPLGKTVIPFRYDEASDFNKYGVAYAVDDKGAHLIDTSGNEIPGTRFPYLEDDLEYEYRYVQFSSSNTDDDDDTGLYDTKERKILCQPRFASFYEIDEDTIEVTVSVKGRRGDQRQWIIDSSGRYKYPEQVGKELAQVNPPDASGCAIVAISTYKKAVETLENDVYCFYMDGETYERRFWFGAMDREGNMQIPCAYENLHYWGGRFYLGEKDGRLFVIDLD